MYLQMFKQFLITVFVLSVSVSVGNAADVFWDAAVSGDWDDPTKWSGGAVPGPGDDVFIDVAGTYTVTLDAANVSVNSLSLGSTSGEQTLSILFRTLTLADASEVGATGLLQLRSSTVNGAGSLELEGRTRILQTSTIGNPTTNSAAGRIMVVGSTLGTSTLRVDGEFENLGSILLTSSDGVTQRAARLTVRSSDILINGTGANISVGVGALAGSRLLTLENNALLRNFGTIDVAQALVVDPGNSAQFDNRGTLNVTGANVTSNQNSSSQFINSGTCNITASRTLAFSSGQIVQQNGTFSGDGLLSLSFNTINGASIFDPEVNSFLRSCTFNVAVANSELMEISNTTTFSSAVENATGAIITILGGDNGNAELRLQARMDNFGLVRLSNESGGSGRLITLRLNNASAHFVNATGATVQVLEGTIAGTRQIVVNGNARFENFATMNANSAYVIDNNTNGIFRNAGTMNVTAANVTLQNSSNSDFFNNGTINVSAGRQILWSSGRFNQAGGAILGAGQSVFDFITFNGSQFTNATTSRMRSTIVNIPYVNQSTLFVRNTCRFVDLFDNDPAAKCIVEGSSVGDAELRVEDRGRNEGQMVLTNTFVTSTRTVRIRVANTARFTNSTNAILSFREGANAGNRELVVETDADFLNFGEVSNDDAFTVDIDSGLFDNRSDITLTSATMMLDLNPQAVFTNAGIIAVSTGLTLSVDNGTLGSNGGEISGGGLLSLIFSTLEGDALVTKINTNMRGSTVNVDMENRGRLNMTGINAFNGDLINGTNATIILEGSVLGGDGTLQMDGLLKNFGDIKLSNSHNASQRTSQIQLNVGANFFNCTGANLISMSGTFGGTRRLSPASGTIFRNFGTISGDEDLLIQNSSSQIDQRGTVNLTSASLTVSQFGAASRFENSGAITIQPGQRMSVSSRVFTHAGGTILGGGEFELSSVTMEGQLPFVSQTPISLRSSFVELPFTNESLVTIRNTATFEDVLINATAATIEIEGSVSGSGQLTANATFANFGLVDMFNSNAASLQSAFLRVGSQMHNAAGATIATRRGANGGTRRIFISGSAELLNEGDIIPSTNSSINNQSGVFTNLGKISLTNANLDIDQTFGSDVVFGGELATATSSKLFIENGTVTISGATINANGIIEAHIVEFQGQEVYTNNTTLIMRDSDMLIGLVNQAILKVRGDSEFANVVTNATAGVVAIEGSTVDQDASMLIDAGLVNNGHISLDNLDENIDRSATLRIEPDVPAINNSTASIEALASFGGDRVIELRSSTTRLQSLGDISAVSGATLTFDGGIATIATGATLSGNGTFDFSQGVVLELFGTIDPGSSPGSFDVLGRFELQPSVLYKAEIGGETAGTEHDQFSVVDGQLVFDGVLDVDLVNGFTPQPGDQFTVIEYSDFTGEFSDIRDTDLGGGLQLVPDYRSDKLVLFVSDETVVNIDIYMQGLWNGTTHKRSAAIVELREGADLSSSVLTTRTSALIDSGGSILAEFDNIQTGDYWLVVRHGGSFAVASATLQTITQGEVNSFDFTDSGNVFNGITGMTSVTLGGVIYEVVRAGDFNQDLSVSADDFIQLFIPNFGVVNPGQVPPLD